jgi:rubrerythrin
MKKNLILGILDNYTFHQVKKFVYSLKRIGFNGDIYLFIGPSTTPGTIRKLKRNGIKLEFFEGLSSVPEGNIAIKTFPLRSPINYYNYRHYLYYDFMIRHRGEYDNVLLTDVKDVYFQADPFSFDMENKLYCALEGPTSKIRTCSYNSKWVDYIYGEEVLKQLGDECISCAGTTWGKEEVIIDYLYKMLQELQKVKDAKIAIDQAIHNYMIYTGMLGEVGFLKNDEGVVLTLSYEEDYTIDKSNVVRVKDDAVVKVIHQFHRRPDLVKATDKAYLSIPPVNTFNYYLSKAWLRVYKRMQEKKKSRNNKPVLAEKKLEVSNPV